MKQKIKMWGLLGPDGLVKFNLSTQPYGLFDTKTAAEQYVAIHHSGFQPVEVELSF